MPFYRAARQVFLDDAKALDPRKELRSDAIDALKGALARVERLEVVGPEPLAVTSEPQSRVSYRLRIPTGSRVPEGHPVVWLAAEPAGLFKSDPPAEGRQAPEVVGLAAEEARQDPAKTAPTAKVHARLDFPLTDRVENAPASFRRPEPRKSAVVLNGVYRGQTLRWETPVTFHPVPEITSVNYPLPTTGKVAVSADAALIRRYGEGGGAVAIVLDCSGSMSAVTARGPDGASARTKYQEATDALREVLAKVGRGTTVSLWVFGEALGPNDTADQAESTILQVLPPTPWRPDDPALLADVMGRVESPKLTPWNESPIVRAMLLARDDLREASGFKTLLVLTDGKDNRFEKDAEINRAKKDIPTAIRDAFSASDIEINVVGYKVADAEEVEAKKQFKVIEELPRAGRFFSVKEARLLASTMSQALRPSLQCALETIGNELVETLTVSRPTDNDRWSEPGLTPRGYKLVARAGGRVMRDLTINRGDLLLVRLADI